MTAEYAASLEALNADRARKAGIPSREALIERLCRAACAQADVDPDGLYFPGPPRHVSHRYPDVGVWVPAGYKPQAAWEAFRFMAECLIQAAEEASA